VQEPFPGQSRKFVTAYPDERQRAHAIRCLGWIAHNMSTRGTSELTWWKISDWVPPSQIRHARRLVICVVLAVDTAVAVAVTPWVALVFAAFFSCFLLSVSAINSIGKGRGKRRSAEVRRKPPCAITPRWPGWVLLICLLLYTVGSIGLMFFPFLLGMWTRPAEERPKDPSYSYRADRLSSFLYGVACAPAGALLGCLVFILAYGSPGLMVDTLLFAVTLSAVIWMARGSSYSLLKLTEISQAVKWRERVNFLHVLEEAVQDEKGILLRSGKAGYMFRDSAMQAYLVAEEEAASKANTGRRTRSPEPAGARFKITWPASLFTRVMAAKRAWIAMFRSLVLTKPESGRRLSESRINRITVDLGAGTAIAVLTAYLLRAIPEGTAIPTLIVDAFFASLFGSVVAAVAGTGLLRVASNAAGKGAECIRRVSRKVRIGIAVVGVAAGAVLVAGAGAFLANALAFLLPSVFVTACGIWLCVLAFRKWRRSPRRWLKSVPDQVAVATSASALLVAADQKLLTTQWATALLFSVAVTGSLRLWQEMLKKRLMIRAAADIALSLMLGGELVLFLVWLANVLGMPRAEVSLIRNAFSSAGSYAGVYDGGRFWAGIYGTLALALLMLVLYPGRLKSLSKWFAAKRNNPHDVASKAQRVVTGLYVGLLTIVFVGVAGPSALTPTLHRQLKTTYVVALQRQLEMEAATAAYDEIRAEINALTAPSAISILAYLVQDIHHDAYQPADAPGSTKAEDTLAHRVGADQAAALGLPGPASSGPASSAAVDPSEPGQPAQQLSNLATKTTAEENASDRANRNLKAAIELAVTAAANVIPIPDISKNEVAQILTQYFTGLVGDSKVTESFETWLEQHRKKPPSPEELIVPDPDNLDNATQNDDDHEATAQGVTLIPADVNNVMPPPSANAAQFDQAMISSAVGSADQAQEIQLTGSCTGCIDLGNNGRSNDDHNDGQPSDPDVGDQ
jgi:hypothetical protein